jgi:hypothetical protein
VETRACECYATILDRGETLLACGEKF